MKDILDHLDQWLPFQRSFFHSEKYQDTFHIFSDTFADNSGGIHDLALRMVGDGNSSFDTTD